MKKWIERLLVIVLVCAVAAAAAVIGVSYYDFISQRIYDDSSAHLYEIYYQVNRSFGSFVERNWGLLEGWSDRFTDPDEADWEDIGEFISDEQEYWGFSSFYLVSADGSCMTLGGSSRKMALNDSWEILMTERQPIMAGEILPDSSEITVFASPVEHCEYSGFGFDAIAISYTNADLASSLNVDAFSGKGKCFVIHSDGNVLLSTQTGGNIFGNYLVYLGAASDLDETALDKIRSDLESSAEGLIQCEIAGVTNFILYQPIGYQDYTLLSVVPQNVVSAGFLSVQKTTTIVLLSIFLMIAATVAVIAIVSSIRNARRNRTELQYRELMFDVLSNSVDDIFIMLDAEKQTVDYISPNIERLLGIPAEDARADIRVLEKCAVNYNIAIPKNELDAIPLNKSRYWECEYMHQTTGERRWYRMTIYHMNIRGVTKYISVMSDRTVEQQMNLKLQEALNAAQSANEAKSNFLSNMSHDIRTPMNAIVGFSVLLEKDADKPDKVREYTRKISASSQHLLSLINDVLDMSKIESGKTSLNVDKFSLPGLLEELNIILMPQAKAKTQEFTTHVQGTPPELLLGDKLRLNQILINLLSNAIKYTPSGGKIEFTVCELPQSAPQYAKLRFIVKDNGIGMSDEFQKHVFDPFSREINSVTNKIQGTGLGMAITKNLVDLMGGIITVESAPGKGSTFTAEFSFALPEQDESDQWVRQKIKRMLVADDEEDICRNISELMEETGVNVSFVTDGASAVKAALEAHSSGSGFDVILLDWKMPGMDGVETARRIREQIGGGVPILVLTSYDWADIEDEARQAGINAFMPKPFFVSTFLQIIRPLFFEQTVCSEKETKECEKALDGRLFLVAEDNELNAEIITEMLALEGAKCELAVNGKEAVKMFTESAPGYYDMILMDVQMPVMNGYEATKAIRESDHPEAKSVPIAAMTANTFAEDVKNSLEAGMNGHLAKPIDMKAVRELACRLFAERGGKNS